MTHDADLIEHYGGRDLLARIESGLAELGTRVDEVTVEQLGPVDEFHIGGRPATIELAERLGIEPGHDLLDVGCGIGGAARFFAERGCRVTGVDLNPVYVDVARRLDEWTGTADRIDLRVGSALDLPVDDASFDRAVQLHVGMNIADKRALFAEVARVVRRGGRFGVYDIVRRTDGDVDWPMPWATDGRQSFLATAADYVEALDAAGFDVDVRDRHAFAVDFFAAQARAAAERSGPPPLGLHLIIGADAAVKLANLRSAVEAGTVGPAEFVATRR